MNYCSVSEGTLVVLSGEVTPKSDAAIGSLRHVPHSFDSGKLKAKSPNTKWCRASWSLRGREGIGVEGQRKRYLIVKEEVWMGVDGEDKRTRRKR